MALLRLEDTSWEWGPASHRILEIFNSTVPPNGPSSPKEAAVALHTLYPDNHPETGMESGGTGSSFLQHLWDIFIDSARQLHHDSIEMERLVSIVKELRELPPRTVQLGSYGSTWQAQLWKDLPFLDIYDKYGMNNDKWAPEGADKKQRFLNLKAGAARIYGLGIVEWEMYAIWDLTDALEGCIRRIPGKRSVVEVDPLAVQDLPFLVCSASQWMIHGGAGRLYGRNEEVHGTLFGPLWKEMKEGLPKKENTRRKYQGLHPHRWALWRERFGVIRDAEGVDEVTRKRANDAFHAMERVEDVSGTDV